MIADDFMGDADFGYTKSVIDEYGWNSKVEVTGKGPVLVTGTVDLAQFDTSEELEAFVAGMAVAYRALPDPIAEELVRFLGV